LDGGRSEIALKVIFAAPPPPTTVSAKKTISSSTFASDETPRSVKEDDTRLDLF
jgi:hypothetical protein